MKGIFNRIFRKSQDAGVAEGSSAYTINPVHQRQPDWIEQLVKDSGNKIEDRNLLENLQKDKANYDKLLKQKDKFHGLVDQVDHFIKTTRLTSFQQKLDFTEIKRDLKSLVKVNKSEEYKRYVKDPKYPTTAAPCAISLTKPDRIETKYTKKLYRAEVRKYAFGEKDSSLTKFKISVYKVMDRMERNRKSKSLDKLRRTDRKAFDAITTPETLQYINLVASVDSKAYMNPVEFALNEYKKDSKAFENITSPIMVDRLTTALAGGEKHEVKIPATKDIESSNKQEQLNTIEAFKTASREGGVELANIIAGRPVPAVETGDINTTTYHLGLNGNIGQYNSDLHEAFPKTADIFKLDKTGHCLGIVTVVAKDVLDGKDIHESIFRIAGLKLTPDPILATEIAKYQEQKANHIYKNLRQGANNPLSKDVNSLNDGIYIASTTGYTGGDKLKAIGGHAWLLQLSRDSTGKRECLVFDPNAPGCYMESPNNFLNEFINKDLKVFFLV